MNSKEQLIFPISVKFPHWLTLVYYFLLKHFCSGCFGSKNFQIKCMLAVSADNQVVCFLSVDGQKILKQLQGFHQ